MKIQDTTAYVISIEGGQRSIDYILEIKVMNPKEDSSFVDSDTTTGFLYCSSCFLILIIISLIYRRLILKEEDKPVKLKINSKDEAIDSSDNVDEDSQLSSEDSDEVMEEDVSQIIASGIEEQQSTISVPSSVVLKRLKKSELVELATSKGIDSSGSKSDIIKRLLEW